MLIVKHVQKSGREHVRPCRTAEFVAPPDGGADKEWPNGRVLAYGCDPQSGGAVDEHGLCRYGDGKVFVMSVEGRTVANYDLG